MTVAGPQSKKLMVKTAPKEGLITHPDNYFERKMKIPESTKKVLVNPTAAAIASPVYYGSTYTQSRGDPDETTGNQYRVYQRVNVSFSNKGLNK